MTPGWQGLKGLVLATSALSLCQPTTEGETTKPVDSVAQADPEPAPSAADTPEETVIERDVGAAITDAEKPPNQLVLSMDGPARELDMLCRTLEQRARESIGGAPPDIGYRCRTDVRVTNEGIPGLNTDELGQPWVAARFLETGHDYAGFRGELRLAFLTDAGWYVSGGLMPLQEDGFVRRYLELELQALPLASGKGKEVYGKVVLERGREFSRGVEDFGTFYEDEATVVCTLHSDGPYCLSAETAARKLEVAYDGVGSGRLRIIKSEEGFRGSLSFPENGIVELSYPETAPSDRRSLAGRYTW